MAMAKRSLVAPLLVFTFYCSYLSVPSLAFADDFHRCLAINIPSQLVFTQRSPSFTPVLVSSIRNPKFNTPAMVKPRYIVTPTNASHVQAAVVCGRQYGVRLRVRSGGHDYEGLSFRSVRPEVFAVVDLSNLRSVSGAVDVVTRWQEVAPSLPEDLDLDLGENVVVGNVSSYESGKVWGEKYFKGNYQRLAMAKGQIDPDDYFRNEQSVPPLVRSQ
ncbi:hypothetical protein EJB05_41196, partial [Eragrostis curvula]